MGVPAFHVSGLAQYADFPLAYYILAVLILFNLYENQLTRERLMILVGVYAGFCAWTKNEGWLFIVVLITARILEGIFYPKNKQQLRKEVIAFLVGISPILIFLFYYNIVFTPTNDLIAGQGATTLERILDPTRHIMIIKSFLSQIYRLDTKHAVPFIVLPLLLIIMGIDKDNLHRNGFLTTILVPILMAAGYYIVFLTTPQELSWHLGTAKERLFFHIWPVSILATFLAIPVLSSSLRTTISKEN
jgi:hypothetical protein